MIHKIFITFCFVFFSISFYIFYKSGNFLKKLFSTVFQGALGLIAVNLSGIFTGVTVSINWFSLGTALLYGIPGCIMLLVSKIIFK